MGRECRRVAPDWKHPKTDGRYVPLHGRDILEFWDEEDGDPQFEESELMPDWTSEQATHYQMYEDTTEGTPISPVFATPEELATWLVENNASAFAGQTATYDGWLRVAQGGSAPSAVFGSQGLQSGVDGLTDR